MEKINLKVELRLSEDLRNAKWEMRQGRHILTMPLGENLAANADLLARAAFTEVSVSKNAAGPSGGQVDATLVPKMISSARVPQNARHPEYKMAVILEWALKDKANQLIWIDTITGEGKISDLGENAEENTAKLTEALVRDLFIKSYEAISSSPEIRAYGAGLALKGKRN